MKFPDFSRFSRFFRLLATLNSYDTSLVDSPLRESVTELIVNYMIFLGIHHPLCAEGGLNFLLFIQSMLIYVGLSKNTWNLILKI